MTSVDPGAGHLPKAPVGTPAEPALKRAERRPNDGDRSSRGDGRGDFAFALNFAAVPSDSSPAGIGVASRHDRSQAAPGMETQPGSSAGTSHSPGRVEHGSREAGGASTGSSGAAGESGVTGQAQALGVAGKAGEAVASGDGGSAPTVETAPGGSLQAQPGGAAEETARQAVLLGRLAARAGAEHVELRLNGPSTHLSAEQGNGLRTVVQPVGPGGQVADAGAHQVPGSTGAPADANAAAGETSTQESRLAGGRIVSSANSAVTGGSTGSEAQGPRTAVPMSQAVHHDGGVPSHTAESGRNGTGAAGGSGNTGAVAGSAQGLGSAVPGKAAVASTSGPTDGSSTDGAQSAGAPAPGTPGEAGGAAHGSREAGDSPRTPGAEEIAGGRSGPSAGVVSKYDGARIPVEDSARQEREAIRSDTGSPPVHGRVAPGTADGSAPRQVSGEGQAAGSANPPASQETQASPLPAADIIEGHNRAGTSGAGQEDVRSAADLLGPTAQARPGTGQQASAQTTGQVVAPQSQGASDPGSTPRILDVTEMPEFLPHTLRAAVRDGVREANIRLWPPELGALKVQLQVHGNHVTALIRAERPDAYALLDRMRGALQRGMQESGLILHRLEIDLGGSTALRSASSAGANQFERDGDPSQRGALDPGHGDRSGTHSSSSQGNRGDADPQARRDAGLNSRAQGVRGGRQDGAPVRRAANNAGGVDAWA